MLVAVETSDLVGSTKMSSEQTSEVLQRLKESFEELNQAGHGRAEFYRGDGFQVIYTRPELAIKYVILAKLFLRSQLSFTVEVTQSLALGEIKQLGGPLSEKMDEVFICSGRQLDEQIKGEISVWPDYLSKDFSLSTRFLNRVISQLTKKQCEVLYWFIKLDYPEQQSIAQRLNMTRQNINTHLHRANTDLIRAYIDHFKMQIEGQL